MAKKAYIGVNNIARKVRKSYIGVGGVARRIKKAYIGIGGVARPCFGSGEIEYYGRITGLSVGRHKLAGASNDNYAMFAGGVGGGTYSDLVDIYNKSLVHTTAALSEARYALAGATLKDGGSKKYAAFAGGTLSSGAVSNKVEFFDNSATKIVSNIGLSSARTYLAGTYMGTDAWGGVAFAGGSTNSSSNAYAVKNIDIFDKSLTSRSSMSLPTARTQLAAASAGDYALFAGGFSVTYSDEVYFSKRTGESSTNTTTQSLSVGRYRLTGGSIGDYALFAGGYEYQNGQSKVVDAYSKFLTKTTAPELSVAREDPAVATIDGYIVFSGGTPLSDAVDIYDQSLTHIVGFNLEVARYGLAGASVGGYALSAGGTSNNGQVTDAVEAFSI